MKYSVIYEVDVPSTRSIVPLFPRNRSPWEQTEDDGQYDESYRGGEWEKGKHRKLCGILTQRQFDSFVEKFELTAENVETMGSLGALGFGVGWAPAIAFNSCLGSGISAYVTPIPEDGDGCTNNEEGWQKVRREIIEKYGRVH
jgi:hypothetical protein